MSNNKSVLREISKVSCTCCIYEVASSKRIEAIGVRTLFHTEFIYRHNDQNKMQFLNYHPLYDILVYVSQ